MGFWNRDESVETRTMRPWALVALVVGVGAVGLGVWAVTRTGLDTENFFTPDETVLGLHHTPALALGEIVFGVLMLFAALSRFMGRPVMALLGIAAAVFGLFVLVDAWTNQLRHWTGVHHDDGWVYLAAGVVAFAGATLLPTLSTRRVIRQPVSEEHHRHWWSRGHAHA